MLVINNSISAPSPIAIGSHGHLASLTLGPYKIEW